MEEPQAGVVETATPCDTGHSVADGHLNSLFFTMLPPELRLNIYEEALEGSAASIVEFPWFSVPNVDDYRMPFTKFMLQPSRHCQLLLTCHAMYEEAMPVYWARTVISMGGRDHCPGSGSMIASIPTHARPYIQHIIEVTHPLGDDGWGYEGWWFTKTLSHLPSLKTCRLVDLHWKDDHSLGTFLDPSRVILTPEDREQRIIYHALHCTGISWSDLIEEPFYSAIVLQRVKAEYTRPCDGKNILRVSRIYLAPLPSRHLTRLSEKEY